VSRTAYKYTLWRTRPWWKGGDTVAVTEGEQAWLDLQDQADTIARFADMVTRSGGKAAEIGQYTADVLDLATGEQVTRLAPTLDDLYAAQNGARPEFEAPTTGPASFLRDVSDEALVRELCRRLTQR
jgi:hypothetical protein